MGACNLKLDLIFFINFHKECFLWSLLQGINNNNRLTNVNIRGADMNPL